MARTILLLSLLLLATGCQSTLETLEPHLIVPAPASFAGFPSPATARGLRAAAACDVELTDEKVVVVRVSLTATDVGRDRPRLDPDTLDPHLYLEDGTALTWIPVVDGEADRPRPPRRAIWNALPFGPLFPDEAAEGCLAFRVPREVRVQPPWALTREGERYRELDLRHSLLSLSVLTATGPRRICVGLAPEPTAR